MPLLVRKFFDVIYHFSGFFIFIFLQNFFLSNFVAEKAGGECADGIGSGVEEEVKRKRALV